MLQRSMLEHILDDSCQMPRLFSFDEVKELFREYNKKIKETYLDCQDRGYPEDFIKTLK